jgi:nucleolar complex protein 2
MGTNKATKKFEKRHLKDTLKRRKDVSKIKQKQQLKAKQKSRHAEDRGDDGKSDDKTNGKGKSENASLENMAVDEFFQNGFEIPTRTKAKRKRTTPNSEKATKKQKLQSSEQDEEDEDLSEASAAAEAVELSEGSSPDSDSDEETHKEQLEALAKKDPEFYKYLNENEPELLDFEEGDFAELDQLSEEEEKPSKRKKKAGKKAVEIESDDESASGHSGDVTLAMVDKWETAMVDQKSLRSTREVVLAFRAAAHLNEAEEGKPYKFTITDSDGNIYSVWYESSTDSSQCTTNC